MYAKHALALFVLLFVFKAPAKADEATPATATLPLEELLALHEAGAVEVPPAPVAPINATLSRVELSGRLLDRAVDLTARFEVVVLSSDTWTTVPLLEIDQYTHVSALPALGGGVLAVRDGQLSFLSRSAGTHSFEISLLKRALVVGSDRHVTLRLEPSTMSMLRLDVDDRLFSLNDAWAADAEGAVLYPTDGAYIVYWARRAEARQMKAAVERPPIESVIVQAHASVVSTLEGRRITRLLYELRFEGSEELVFQVPAGQEVSKVFLNGGAIPFEFEGGALTVAVSPEREGDESGRVELVLEAREPGYSLSGSLGFTFPAVSWSTNELFVDLHLPRVFNYAWSGGSLSPDGAAHEPQVFTETLPTPGKTMTFHQYLIEGGASLRVNYTVDLAGRFYR